MSGQPFPWTPSQPLHSPVAGGGGPGAPGSGLAVASNVAEGVIPNRLVPTPFGEGNVTADIARSSGVRQSEPAAKRVKRGGTIYIYG